MGGGNGLWLRGNATNSGGLYTPGQLWILTAGASPAVHGGDNWDLGFRTHMSIPEPGALTLLGLGLVGVVWRRRKRVRSRGLDAERPAR